MKKEEGFGIIPIFKKGDETLFLVIHRKEGFWEFPKGHKEEGESGIEAAKREFEEETDIKDYEILDENTFFEDRYIAKREGKEDREKTVKYYLAETNTQEVTIQQGELKGFKWLNFDDSMAILTYPGAKNLLKKIINF